VPSVYTAHVLVRHDELDGFGRVHPGVYLRYLAHAAVEASAAVGFDAAWYAAAGSMWIIRRSTLSVIDPLRGGERLAVHTWVEDFRRVRSHRRYAVHGDDGRLRLEAVTDWVYVDAATGRPRRVPAEFGPAFGIASAGGPERAAWEAPAPPATPARTTHRVRACDLDGLGHVNNAVYLDLLGQAVLDALEAAGWPLARLLDHGGVPIVERADLEYLAGALYGERLTIGTWFTPTAGGLEAHHHVDREGEGRPLLRAATRWRWAEPANAGARDVPSALMDALRPLIAA
jgi:acyl-CoA thioester hydrolase